MPQVKNNLTPAEIKQKAAEIQNIYNIYMAELKKLKEKQNKVIDEHMKKLEQKKIAETKDILNNLDQ
ncbi:MAG: hypothetical protein HQ530_00515 [Parcubacteria group bacterium]|nr:hypothetical protein [Parcubacteria group bacterium]